MSSCCCSAPNPYDRQKVITACEIVLDYIQRTRECRIERLLEQHRSYRKYWFFGPTLTRSLEETQVIVQLRHELPYYFARNTWGRWEGDVTRILSAARFISTFADINLTATEFKDISFGMSSDIQSAWHAGTKRSIDGEDCYNDD